MATPDKLSKMISRRMTLIYKCLIILSLARHVKTANDDDWSNEITSRPSSSPSNLPTNQPSAFPSSNPSVQPTKSPSSLPSLIPSAQPTISPSTFPSHSLSPSSPPTALCEVSQDGFYGDETASGLISEYVRYDYEMTYKTQGNLQQIVRDLERAGAPLLQAAIMAHSSNRLMAQIIHLFPWAKLTRDSTGRLPIQLAVETGLTWDQGIELLVHNTSTHPDILPIHTAATYGLKWENGMKDIVEDDLPSLGIADPTTNLYPFALAASTNENDLTSIYELIRHRVDLLMIP